MSEDKPNAPPPQARAFSLLRNWRKLVTEIGVVVIGVGLALAGQQMVDGWRERRQYREARQAMFDELSGNITNIRQRLKYAACTQQRLKDIAALLDLAESGRPFQAPSWIGLSVSFRVRFVAEAEAQRSTLFSSAEQRNFGTPYSYFHSIDVEQDRERLAWGRLRMLQGRSRLGPEMIQSLRNAVADAAYENDRLAWLMAWVEGYGRRIGLKDLTGPAYTPTFFQKHPHCLPMNMPAAEAERLSALTLPPNL
jgi:hypothetical protein